MSIGFKGKYFSLCALSALAGAIALEANEVRTLQKIEVHANDTAQEIREVSDVVELITSEDIEELGCNTLGEVLSTIAGVSISSSGMGQPLSMFLRGYANASTLVLVDGVRLNDVTGLNGAQLELIDVASIEQIEVIKGAQSGLFGADSLGGVIRIRTKKSNSAQIEYGSFATQKLSMALAHQPSKNLQLLSNVVLLKSAGYSSAEPKQSDPAYGTRGKEPDAYQNRTLNLKVNYQPTKNDTLKLSLSSIDAKVHFDGGAGIDANDRDDLFGFGESRYINDIQNRFYKVDYLRDDARNQLNLGYEHARFFRSQYGAYGGNMEEFTLNDRFDYVDDAFIRVGMGYQSFYQGDSAGVALNERYENRYAFATHHINLDALSLTQSVRLDNYSDFKDKSTYKLGAKYALNQTLSLSANLATGYKIPTLYQLFDAYAGQQALNPEQMQSVDISLNLPFMRITYFDSDIKDIIDYDFSSYQYNNIAGTSTLKGVESSLFYTLFDALYLQASYTYLDAKDSNGARLLRRERDKYGYALRYYGAYFSASLNGYYIGSKKDLGDVQIGHHNVSNLAFNLKLNPNSTLYLNIHNLFDRFYQGVDGYATEGLSFYGGLRLSL